MTHQSEGNNNNNNNNNNNFVDFICTPNMSECKMQNWIYETLFFGIGVTKDNGCSFFHILFNFYILRHIQGYHWRDLPQVSFLSRQHVFVATNTYVATKVCLSWQNFCFNKHTTNVLSRQFLFFIFFVKKNMCSRQKFYHFKHTFVATKELFCRYKNDTCGPASLANDTGGLRR